MAAGSIRKRGAGYSIIWDLPRGPDGRRRQKEKGGYRTRKAAEAALRKILADLDAGTYSEPTKQSTAAFLREWMAVSLKPAVAAQSYQQYASYIERHLIRHLGAVPLAKLSAFQIQKLYAELADHGREDGKGLHPNTLHRVHQLLGRALAQAVRWQMLTRNPMDHVDAPRKLREKRPPVPAADVLALLGACEEEWVGLAILVAVGTGFRIGEVVALRWSDCRLTTEPPAGTITSSRSAVLLPGGMAWGPRKGRDEGDSVTMKVPAFLVVALQRHRQLQDRDREAFGPDYADEGLILAQPTGRPWHPFTLRRRYNALRARCGLSHRFHDLRHCNATLMLTEGIPLPAVSRRLGHRRVSTTADVYAGALPVDDEKAAAALDRVFSGLFSE